MSLISNVFDIFKQQQNNKKNSLASSIKINLAEISDAFLFSYFVEKTLTTFYKNIIVDKKLFGTVKIKMV